MARNLRFPDEDCPRSRYEMLVTMSKILSEAAVEADKVPPLGSYSEIAIHNYLNTCRPETTDVALKRPQRAEDARAELQQLELVMDKKHFTKLVTNGGLARCGVGKNGETVTWMTCIENGT